MLKPVQDGAIKLVETRVDHDQPSQPGQGRAEQLGVSAQRRTTTIPDPGVSSARSRSESSPDKASNTPLTWRS